ncbi:biotin--[acetyl-CoA-carboxylase] ligase [Blattabacterium cuenoti]|uniref:biotin--[acetyl-CoA-carboxylase] ligase n=1 Tax=Blattabacterium cuenoti TaxID=1653831 RepID=UPI00163CCCD7|nr:biotin--[acetyl-CoA-carboxylase] ligase [Blattabacterium cuenoti]
MKNFIWPIYLIFIKKVDSTNKYLKKNKSIYYNKDWIIVWSKNQTKGRGVGKNNWISEKEKNLTFSIFIKSITLDTKKAYIINLLISNAIHKILFFHYKMLVWIKWPNDIILMNKKIGGILIENEIFFKKIKKIIVGIGLNVNQTNFDIQTNISSMKQIYNNHFHLDKLLYEIIYSIQNECFLFTSYGESFIRKYYIKFLYRKNKKTRFFIFNNSNCEIKGFTDGIIRNITNEGHLIVELLYNKKKISFFSQKEIKTFF